MVDAMRGQPHKARDLKLVILVNPDKEARARIWRVLSERISSETRIITFDRFEEFAKYLDAV